MAKMVLVKRSKNGRLADINNGDMFQFLDGSRKTYVMVDNHEGAYRQRSGDQSIITVGNCEDRWTMGVVEVFEMPALTERGQRGFDAIVAKGKELGQPEAFYDDLWIHDRRMIAMNDPAVFGWSVRECGTHLMIPNDVYSLFLTAHEQKKHEREQKEHRHFFFNGDTLKEMPIDLIEERLVKASTPKCREFAKMSWHTKNNTTLSGEWQKEIDNELAGKATLRAELIGHPYC